MRKLTLVVAALAVAALTFGAAPQSASPAQAKHHVKCQVKKVVYKKARRVCWRSAKTKKLRCANRKVVWRRVCVRMRAAAPKKKAVKKVMMKKKS